MQELKKTQKYSGVFSPRELHELVSKGEKNGGISPTAAWLTLTILGLSKQDRGCYASNRYLAKQLNKSVSQMAVLLRKLEKAKILKSEWIGEERRLRIDLNCQCLDIRDDNYKKRVIDKDEKDLYLNCEPLEELKKLSYIEYLQSNYWKVKRRLALGRSKFRCQLCNSDKKLNVHHRSYDDLGEEDIRDLITLCKECHEKFHKDV